MDDLALPTMDALLACLCAEVAASPGGEVCYCALVPGGQAIADFCSCGNGGCGQAWVRFVRSFPSSRLPNQDTDPTNCSKPQAMVLEVGVYRCLPTSQTAGQPPTALEQTQATIVQMGDWKAVRTAIRCCEALNPFDAVLGAIEVRSQGACGGPVGQVTIRLSKAPR